MTRYLLDTGIAQDFIIDRRGVRIRVNAARLQGNRIGICYAGPGRTLVRC